MKSTHGGKRAGAGRKRSKEPIIPLSATIYAEDLKLLKSLDPIVRIAIRKLINQSRRT